MDNHGHHGNLRPIWQKLDSTQISMIAMIYRDYDFRRSTYDRKINIAAFSSALTSPPILCASLVVNRSSTNAIGTSVSFFRSSANSRTLPVFSFSLPSSPNGNPTTISAMPCSFTTSDIPSFQFRVSSFPYGLLVTTIGPCSVTTTVCSKWAHKLESAVEIVHPSSATFT